MTTKRQAKRRYVPDFDARSLMLIAAWTVAMAGSGAVYAQTPPPPPAQPSAPMAAPAGAMDPPPASKKDAAASFERADANHDGKLSRNEAAAIPWLEQHFDEADANHDGSVTRDEYNKALTKN
ncbi:MAG: EF-hand domain-containing protein [Proteobacteria bacterium]|nr:EF-hand domain-containing protein [Pseudomonadota bacterium]